MTLIPEDRGEDPKGGWTPPRPEKPGSVPRALSCVCARCRGVGPCEDFSRIEGRWYHRGECAEKQQQTR